MVVFKTQRPGQRCQRFQQINNLIFNTCVGNFDIHARGTDGAMYAHIFAIDKFTFQGGQTFTLRFDLLEYLFKAAHHKLSLRINFAKFLHHFEDILLQWHLVMPIRQQNLFGYRRFFQHVKITVEAFA